MTAEIKKLNIIRFGKLKDLEINFDKGLNVIYGANEAGKSTINLFIKAMLYGLSSKKPEADSKKEREQAVPWNEKNGEGFLTVKSGNKIIEIRRVFGKTAKGDKLEVVDGSTGEKIDEYKESSIGQWLFGISQTVFEKTLWVRQNGTCMSGEEDELLKKIINLSDGGDENVSAGEAIRKLADKKKELKARDKRSTPGKLDILEERLDSCKREKYELSTKLSQGEATRVRKREAGEELLKVKEEIETLEKAYNDSIEYEKSLAEIEVYKRICDCDTKILDINNSEEFKNGSKLTDDVIEKAQLADGRIDDIGRELSELDRMSNEIDESGRKGLPLMSVILGGIFGILGIVGIVLSVTAFSQAMITVLSLIVCVASAVVLASGVRRIDTALKGQIEKEKKKSQLDLKRVSLNGERDALNKDLGRLLEEFAVADVKALIRLYMSVQGLAEKLKTIEALKYDLCSKYDIEKLKEASAKFTDMIAEPSEVVDRKLRAARQKHLELTAEIKELEGKMAYQVKEHRIPADIDTEMNAIKEEIKLYTRKLQVIDAAIENITVVADNWKSTVTPKLNNKVNEIMNCLTNGKYGDVRVSEKFEMRVASDKVLYDAEYLSKGTYSQLYLALRIALAKLENDENPMFLDDILTLYDDERAEYALKYLTEESRGGIFLFTCHRFIKEKAEALGANIINL